MQKSFLSLTCYFVAVVAFCGFFVVFLMGRGSIWGHPLYRALLQFLQGFLVSHDFRKGCFVMSEQPRRHGRLPRISKQIFLSHHWICVTCYIIIITVTSHHITPTIGSNKFQFANITIYVTLLLSQKN